MKRLNGGRRTAGRTFNGAETNKADNCDDTNALPAGIRRQISSNQNPQNDSGCGEKHRQLEWSNNRCLNTRAELYEFSC
jgi:hypothetical protein